MKHCCSFFLFFFISFSLSAQKNGSVIRISPEMFDAMVSDIDTLTGIRGKCVVPEMDTLYLINPVGVKEFVACSVNLERCRQLSLVTEDLAADIASLQKGVQSLDNNTASFREYALMFQKENALRLQELEKVNKVLENNLQSIQLQLEEAREKIRAERWNSLTSKILWGTGGFVAGTLFMSVVFVILK